MKKLLILFLVSIFVFGLIIGCGKKDAESDKMPAEVKEAEMMDSTRMDSSDMIDSLADEAKKAVEGAVDEAKDAVDDAADKAKDAMGGH